ncbi:MAG: dTDP-4-dehydrorhamnose reductase, partial [Gammaproteobacteria bacterium]
MKILLLGANGQLGSDIVRASHSFEIIPWLRCDLDITDNDALKTKLMQQPFDVLINCTSYHNTDQAETNAGLAFSINAHAVKEMALLCKEKKARFMHISTDYVFSHGKTPLTETSSPSPLNVYGASKLMGETLAQAVYDDVMIFRVASLFGIAGASGKGGNFVETMIRLGREKGKLRVIADQIMSPTATADIAEMLIKALEANIPSGIYHAVNTGYTSWYEFAKQIIAGAQVNAVVEPISAAEYPSITMRPSYSALDNSKLARLIGPIPTWQAALDKYL